MDIEFIPVNITRGRKFKGFGYIISGGYTYSRGYSGSGVDPLTYTDYCKIWDPKNMKCCYCNADYPVKADIPVEQLEADKEAYVNFTIQSTIAWCKSKQPKELEARRFARNCLLKNHPEMKDYIDKALPDERDVVAAVENTLRWAMSKKTKAYTIYGKRCAGGKAYSPNKIVKMAYSYLDNHGYTKLEGFKEAWLFMTNMFELPDYGVKI